MITLRASFSVRLLSWLVLLFLASHVMLLPRVNSLLEMKVHESNERLLPGKAILFDTDLLT